MNDLWLPRVHTLRAEAAAIGAIVDAPTAPAGEQDKKKNPPAYPGLLYLRCTGPQAMLKSVWATGVASRAATEGIFAPALWGNAEYLLEKPTERFATALGDLPYQDWLLVANLPDLIYVSDPRAVGADTKQRAALLREHEPAFIRGLVRALNATTDLPIHPLWGAAIYADCRYNDQARRNLAAYGEVLMAWRLNPSYDWAGYIQAKLDAGELPWPKPTLH